MKKRIVIPSYQDRQATNGWEKKYQKSSDYDVIVYEKDDSLPAETEVETFEGFRISTDLLTLDLLTFFYIIYANFMKI